MRVAIITESFLPQVNGVTNSVLRLCEELPLRGHDLLVVAPGAGPTEWAGVRVVRTPGWPLPGYRDFRVARPWSGLPRLLREFRPDVVHLASPAVLGMRAVTAAEQVGVPCVAVYQTDLMAYAARYRLRLAEPAVRRRIVRLHSAVARTLAPSRAAARQLESLGVPRVERWGRGVDTARFSPARRDACLRRTWAPGGEVVVGYVGRLAAEKEVELLAPVQDLPGVRLVVVGDGPLRRSLARQLPRAEFTGQLGGDELARAFASLDVFVHTGRSETFCQAVQEALASGVPVVAPAAGGPLDLVVPGRTGLLFDPGSAADLRDRVQELVDDPVLRTRMATHAGPSVSGRTWAALAHELAGHYRAVLGSSAVERLVEAA